MWARAQWDLVPRPASPRCAASGGQLQPGVQFKNGEVGNARGTAPADCCQQCGALQGCAHFSSAADMGRCWFFSNGTHATNGTGNWGGWFS